MNEEGAAPAAQDSPAFPRAARMLAVILLADLVLLGLWQAPKLVQAEWSATGLVVFLAAAVMVLWMGIWIVRSRTRLVDGELSQTWVWTKRVRVGDVASLKLVHLPWLERIVAPRLLVRRRGGGVTWFHSADPQLLIAFSLLVAQQHLPARK